MKKYVDYLRFFVFSYLPFFLHEDFLLLSYYVLYIYYLVEPDL